MGGNMNNEHNKPKILVVDDHPLSAQIAARLLVRLGMHTALAADGRDALDWLAEEPFDAVISDIEMPGMDGFELLQQIRQLHPELPVILMTAFPDDEKLDAARLHGAAGLLKKPYGGQELAGTLEAALRRADRKPALVHA
jgi:CheY-like chemotaxis protein